MTSDPPEHDRTARLRKLEKCTTKIATQMKFGIGLAGLVIGAVLTTGIGQWQASIAMGEQVRGLRENVGEATRLRERNGDEISKLRTNTSEDITELSAEVSGLKATVTANETNAASRDGEITRELAGIRRALRN